MRKKGQFVIISYGQSHFSLHSGFIKTLKVCLPLEECCIRFRRHFPCLTMSNKWLHLLLLGVVCCSGTLIFVTIQRGSVYKIELIVDRSIGGTFYKNILKSVTDK